MNPNDTTRKLSEMTDEAEFERLAGTILRLAGSDYKSLTTTGVNTAGKTVRSPLDGICYVPHADSPHLVIVHHTTTDRLKLREKSLHDPTNRTPNAQGRRSAAPAGDVIKAAELFQEEKQRREHLVAILVLTTNQPPSQDLYRDTHAFGASQGLAIDIWSVSRMADFLDNDPSGQWLRQQYFGIDQQRLSRELLAELSRNSLEHGRPKGEPSTLVARDLDRAIRVRLCL
jgi:hypothetical protein